MDHDYVVFVLPTPWRWLSLACCVLSLACFAMVRRRQSQTRRQAAKLVEPLIAIAERYGTPEEAAETRRQVERLRGGLLGFFDRKPVRREAVTTDGSRS